MTCDTSDKVSILIVDDSSENLRAMEALLKRPDRVVLQVQSGEEALRCLLTHDVAVILLDIRMAEMDGYETAALIRKREKTRHLPIIFLTAFNKDGTDILKGYSLGAVDYIFKPLVPEILCAKIDVFAELYKTTQALRRKNEELERTERELRLTNERLEELNRLKSSFVSVASHEIRTPVTGIKAYVDNILCGLVGPVTDKQRQYLTRVTHNVDRLMKIIEELLDLAKIEAGQLQLHLASIPIAALIHHVTDELGPMAQEKQISLHTSDCTPDVCVHGDEGKLHQVLTNLVHNAIKFTHVGGRVEVEVRRQEDGALQIRVTDTGPGIPAADLSKIFDRFYSSSSAPPETRGAGLGLTISKSLVALHGGNLWVTSIADQGSSFYIDLPASAVLERV